MRDSRAKLKSSTQTTISLGPADRILLIDSKRCEVTCEPGVTMEALVDALLSHKLLPFVVPEFKALTVGGVLAGAGLESSSWSHGQFGDHLLEATYILSDGSVIDCSPQSHADLFYGALGACGTLGLLVKARLKVQRLVSEFVDVRYIKFPVDDSVRALKTRMETIKSIRKTELLDAIVDADFTTIITAELNHPGPVTQSFSRGRDPWFYQYVSSISKSRDVLHVKDYLFRYDAGAFWMSSYAISPVNDLQDLCHAFLPPITDPYTKKVLSLIPFGGYNFLSRWLLSPLLKTAAMYKRLHQAPTSIIADTLLIQDVYVPFDHADTFLIWLRSRFGLEKLWLCPVQSTTTPQLMSPNFVTAEDKGFINFGVWMHKPSWQPGTPHARRATREIEQKVSDLGGRKMLYSLSHYSPKQWESIYDVHGYRKLKQEWDPNHAWDDIYEKVGRPPA